MARTDCGIAYSELEVGFESRIAARALLGNPVATCGVTHNSVIQMFTDATHKQPIRPTLQTAALTGRPMDWLVQYLDSMSFQNVSPHSELNTDVGSRWSSNHESLTFQKSQYKLAKIRGIKGDVACILSDSLQDIRRLCTAGLVYEGAPGGSKVRIKRATGGGKADLRKVKEVRSRCCLEYIPKHVLL